MLKVHKQRLVRLQATSLGNKVGERCQCEQQYVHVQPNRTVHETVFEQVIWASAPHNGSLLKVHSAAQQLLPD